MGKRENRNIGPRQTAHDSGGRKRERKVRKMVAEWI